MKLNRILAIAAAAALILPLSAPAQAATDLTGKWNSDSLSDNKVGYHLELMPVPNTAAGYIGTLRFTYQDGRKGSRVPIKATTNGNKIKFTARKGSFDKSAGVLRGVLSNNGSVLTLTNCTARLQLVMANALDSDCVFRPVKSR
jgi:hypothetical protein